jgi:hypothetical protein
MSCSSFSVEAGLISQCLWSFGYSFPLSAKWCYVRALCVLFCCILGSVFAFMFQCVRPCFPLPNPAAPPLPHCCCVPHQDALRSCARQGYSCNHRLWSVLTGHSATSRPFASNHSSFSEQEGASHLRV